MARLEQILLYQPLYTIANLENLSASVLYTRPIRIYDFRDSGFQFHVHGSSDGNYIYGGSLKVYGSNETLKKFDGYEASMLELYAQCLGIKRLDRGKDYK